MRAAGLLALPGVFALALALAAPRASAGDAEGGTPLKLGSPASAEDVDALLGEATLLDAPTAETAAARLGIAGGSEAVRGLGLLLDHPAETVRLASMTALTTIGLRSATCARRLRQLAVDGTPAEQEAALAALAAIGDGRDMDTFLAVAAEEDARRRVMAFRCMKELTGAAIPFVRPRWSYYWRKFSARSAKLLPGTLDALEEAPDAPDTADLVGLVRRYAWVDAEEIGETLETWLVAPDHDLRAIACALAADLRLADLAPDVREALRYASTPALQAAARDALRRLGVPLDDRPPPAPED